MVSDLKSILSQKKARRGLSPLIVTIMLIIVALIAGVTMLSLTSFLRPPASESLQMVPSVSLSPTRDFVTVSLQVVNNGGVELKLCEVYVEFKGSTNPTITGTASLTSVSGVVFNASVNPPTTPSSCGGPTINPGQSLTLSFRVNGAGFYSGIPAVITVFAQRLSDNAIVSFTTDVVFR